jgi:hypothetical protein
VAPLPQLAVVLQRRLRVLLELAPQGAAFVGAGADARLIPGLHGIANELALVFDPGPWG